MTSVPPANLLLLTPPATEMQMLSNGTLLFLWLDVQSGELLKFIHFQHAHRLQVLK